MKNRLALVTSLALLFAGATEASLPPKPEKCPSVSAIVAAGVDQAMEQDQNGRWIAVQMSHPFDTKETWSFAVGFFDSTDENDVVKQATAALPTLAFTKGPTPYEQQGVWLCQYNGDEGIVAAAFTPAYSNNMKFTLKQLTK